MRKINFNAALLLPLLANTLIAAEPATLAPSTQPITTGRDTPAGAINVYEHAIDTGDLATVADTFNLPQDARQAVAREHVAANQFAKAMDAGFGHDATLSVCNECRLPIELTDMKYTNDLWTLSPQRSDEASGNWQPSQTGPRTQFMQRGSDGIWRIGRMSSPRRPATAQSVSTRPVSPLSARIVAQADSITARLQPVTSQILAGKFASPDDVSSALYPEGTPESEFRRAKKEQKKSNDLAAKKQEQELMAAHFDPATLDGAIGAYTQALYKHDPAAMAKFYFLESAPDDTFALATAKRILAANDFQRVISEKIDPGTGLAITFGFLDQKIVFFSPWVLMGIKEHGDTAVIAGGGQDKGAVWFRKIGGVWKQEITPPPARSIADSTEDFERDTAAVARITTDIDNRKYKTVEQIRDALGNAMLNSFSDPTFMQVMVPASNNAPPKQHENPEPKGSQPASPTTPAGAMNRFIRAAENADLPTVAASLYVPNDKDGLAAVAMAHDYIQGIQYLRALQAQTPGFDANMFCFSCDILGPVSLRDYTDDEWTIPSQYPELAVSSGVSVGKTSIENGQKSTEMQHGWTPIMHRGTDGIWRLGPWYPQSPRQLAIQTKMLAAKDALLAKATADLNANKVKSIDDLANQVIPKLKEMGARPIASLAM